MAKANMAEAPETTEAGDAPLIDLNDASVKKLLARAKKRGYITYDQLNEALPQDQLHGVQQVLDRYGTQSNGEARFDSLISRRAGSRNFVDVHMHVPAEWTLGRAAQLRTDVETALMQAVPNLRATIEILPLGQATVFETVASQNEINNPQQQGK